MCAYCAQAFGQFVHSHVLGMVVLPTWWLRDMTKFSREYHRTLHIGVPGGISLALEFHVCIIATCCLLAKDLAVLL